jgi:tetratricopeptide (TPR) repeat protein
MHKTPHTIYKFLCRSVLLLCALFFMGSSHAQQYNIDSLLQEFKYSDGVDLRTYDQLFIALYPEYMEELVLVAEDLLTQSVRTKNMNGMHRAADAFGVYFIQKGYFNQAFKILYRSMRYYERTDNQAYLMKAYHYLGTLFLSWGNIEESIYWFEKCREIAKENPDKMHLHTVQNNLALAYMKIPDNKQALQYLNANEKDSLILDDEAKIALLNMKGNYWLALENYSLSKNFYNRSKDAALKEGWHRHISTAYMNLAVVEFSSDIDLAKTYFDSSVYYAKQSGLNEKISLAYFNLAAWHAETQNIDSSIYYFSQSFSYANEINNYENMVDALDEMSGLYRELNKWISVDSINGILREVKTQQYSELLNMESDYDLLENAFAQNTPFLEVQAQTVSDKALFRTTLIISLLVLLLVQFLAILYLSYRFARKH